MSGIGFWELIILFLIGLIVLGPERLPRVANQLGTWLGQARRMTRVMRRQLEEEVDFGKELNLKPDADKDRKSSYSKPEYVSRNKEDDSYSPAHDADSVGTGVDDAIDPDEEDTDVMPVMDEVDPHAETDVIPESDAKTEAAGAEEDGTVPAEPVKEKSA